MIRVRRGLRCRGSSRARCFSYRRCPRSDLVAKKLRDWAEVEVDEHDCDEGLTACRSSNASTFGGGDDVFPVVLESAVQGLDRLPSVIVELVPLGTHEGERLLLPQGVFLGERDGVFSVDSVEEFRDIVLFNGRAFLVCSFLRSSRSRQVTTGLSPSVGQRSGCLPDVSRRSLA